MARVVTSFRADDAARMAEARRIRTIVFCEEQQVPANLEWDGKDDSAEHYLLTDGCDVIGTARTRALPDGSIKVERVAVLKERRGTGAGRYLMNRIMERLQRSGAKVVVLNAQAQVEDFYLRLGFVSEGDRFMEAHIPHVHMRCRM